MLKKRILWVTFLLLLFVCSYSREVLFRSINAYMAGKTDFYAKTISIDFLSDFSVIALYRLKYFLTVAYSLLFIAFTSIGLKWSFSAKLPFLISLFLYAILCLIAGVVIVIALIVDDFSGFYPFLRDLVGLIHNPLLFIILSIVHLALNKYKGTFE